jgi:hypothetical protein
MKYARLAWLALAAALGGVVLIPSQPASGQVNNRPASSTSAVAQAPASPYTQEARNWYYGFTGGQRTSNPELDKLVAEEGRLEGETANLVGEYSRTEDEAQRSKTKAKLAATLEKQFELQQKRRDLEVAHIEAQLKKLREIMRKRGEARQTIVDKRLDQLLREADGLGWTPPHGTPAPKNASYNTYPRQSN